MKLSALTTTLGLTILAADILFAQVATPQNPTIDLASEQPTIGTDGDTTYPHAIELTAETCSTPANWTQSLGPTSVEILGSGSQAVAQINQPGSYGFEYSCCSFDRKSSLINSNSLVGFGENTTGGLNSNGFTVVSNTNDDGPGSLREALSLSGPNWIIFDTALNGRTIYLNSPINVKNPDITIDGRGSTVTVSPAQNNMFLIAFRGGNTILHGIKLDGQGLTATALMLRQGYNYWIDHLTITNFQNDDAISIGQGGKTDSASEITISNYKVHSTSKGILSGGNGNYPDFPTNRVTVHSSELAAGERNPRVQYGSIYHVFNSYIHSFKYVGMEAGRNAKLISENNVFSALTANNPKNAQTGRYASSNIFPAELPNGPIGHIYSRGDLFLDDSASSGSINPTTPTPFNIPYNYELLDVNLVRDAVLQKAGAENINNSLNQCQVQRISQTVP